MSDNLPGVSPFFKRNPGTLGFIRNIRKPKTVHGWTDEVCLVEGQKYCLWKEIPENEVERHLINFVNLWFASNNKSPHEITSIIRNVLLITPVGMSDDLLLRNVLDSAPETAKTPPARKKEYIIEELIVSHFDQKEKADVFAFHKWLKQNFYLLQMEAKKTSAGQLRSSEYNLVSQRLRVVIGFCALLLVRLLTKNVLQFKRYFPHAATKTFHRLFPETGLNVSLVASAPRSLELVSRRILDDWNGRPNIDLLYLVVFQYLKSTSQDDRSSKLTKEILEEGCLKVLEGNGMGLVTLFQDVKKLYPDIEDQRLLSMIANHERDMKSLKRLDGFLKFYAQPDEPQYSWKWARLLCQNYFSDMNIRENRFLCCKFAALLADENPGIFQHKDLKCKDFEVEFAMKWVETAKVKLQLNRCADEV